MSADRAWKTELEIRAIVHQEMRDQLKVQNDLLEKIRDGAQASIYSATILHGNMELGLKGAIPDILERLQGVEDREVIRDDLQDKRHVSNDERLGKLEVGQHRIRRFLMWCVRFVTSKQDDDSGDKSKLSWWRLATIAGALGTGWHWVHDSLPAIGKKLAAAAHALARP